MRRQLVALTSAALLGAALTAHSTARGAIQSSKERSVTATSASTTKTRGPAKAAASASSHALDGLPPDLRAAAKAKIEAKLLEDVAKIGTLRASAEKLLEEFIRDEPADSPDLPEALLRLAEIKYETSKDAYLASFRAWEAQGTTGRGPPPTLDVKLPRALVQRVIDKFPTYADYDLALYVDAAIAGEEGDDKTALQRFTTLLEKYPKSRFVADAHMARGEAAFEGRAAWKSALDEYEEVLKHPEADVYGLAMFKSAWCLWKLGRQDEAAKRFTAVLELTSAQTGATMSKREALESLEDEALKALVDVFARGGDTETGEGGASAKDVYDFLVRIDGERFAGKVLRKLADAYDEDARYKKEIEAYELLRRIEPTSPDGTDHVLAIARAQATMGGDGEEEALAATYQRLLDDHLPEATISVTALGASKPVSKTTPATWAKAQTDPAVVAASTKKIEDDLRTRALEYHARGQATGSKQYFALAAKLYHLYLSRFGTHENAYEVYFYAGEVELHRLSRFSDAADDYLACAKLNAKGGLSRDALFNALFALEKLRAQELAAGKGSKPGEETDTDRRFAEALAFYASAYPDDPEIPGFLLAQGVTYYDHKVYDPAIRIFGELVSRYPKSREAFDAGERMLDALVHAQDFGNVEKWARTLKGLSAFAADAQQKRLDGLIVQAVFKQGESLAAKKDHAGAATAYLRAAREFPKDERAAKACVNAVVEAKLAGDLGLAKEGADVAIRDHEGAPEAAQAVAAMSEALRLAGLLSEAAGYDEAIVAKYPKDVRARDASFNAVVARTALGDYDRAVKDAGDYLRLYGSASADDADEVTFLLGKAHERAKHFTDAEKLYAGYASRAKNLDHKIEALVRLALVRVELKDRSGADRALDSAVKLGHEHQKTLKEGKTHAAHARYLQGEQIVAQYDAVTLDASGAELKKRLDKKKDLLKSAAGIFADCAKMGSGEWATAALYRIGYVFEGFANALKTAQPPAGVKPEDADAFRQIVDPIAEQFLEKAIDAYENGWKKAVELKIFNKWTADMRAALARLSDVAYPPLREQGIETRTVGPAPLPAPIDAPTVAPKPAAATAPATAEKK